MKKELLTPKPVELLAPAGSFEVLKSVIEAGADAVYLGGKKFNMRMHRTDANLDDESLHKAVEYAHNHNVFLYVTVNNLISQREIPDIKNYLKTLQEIKPDALIIQDLAIVGIAREMDFTIPLHSSVMMNIHNEPSVRLMKEWGITRVVASRELNLAQLALIKERMGAGGIELEYFIHGDMCTAYGGQCYQSGIIFAQSSNRGRCLKPCRWPYQFVDTSLKTTLKTPGEYLLAVKDMCLYTALPLLIQSGVYSFKIEGRMRTADFVSRIVRIYRKAIDRYLADPTGYTLDEEDWRELFDRRVRNFSTCFAFGEPGSSSIDYSGEREPRFFSQAVKEPDLDKATVVKTELTPKPPAANYSLAVRVADLDGMTEALENGADITYVGGEAFKPAKPFTIYDIEKALDIAQKYNSRVVVATGRITMERELRELEYFISKLEELKPHGLLVGNLGTLHLAKTISTLPVQADFSLNIFNYSALKWLETNKVVKAAVSLEATYEEIAGIIQASRHDKTDRAASNYIQDEIQLEVIVHGALEAMVMEHCLLSQVSGGNSDNKFFCQTNCSAGQYELADTAGERRQVKIDQYCRNHLLFAKDLCLLPHLAALAASGIEHYRIEGQHYSPGQVGIITGIYRQQLDKIASEADSYHFDESLIQKIAASSPRELGCGVFRNRLSR